MKHITVYGPGCKRCANAEQVVRDAAQALSLDVQIEKISDFAEIAKAGVVSTPAIGIDGKLVHAGSVPSLAQMQSWLSA